MEMLHTDPKVSHSIPAGDGIWQGSEGSGGPYLPDATCLAIPDAARSSLSLNKSENAEKILVKSLL